jgi:hypothetical protein
MAVGGEGDIIETVNVFNGPFAMEALTHDERLLFHRLKHGVYDAKPGTWKRRKALRAMRLAEQKFIAEQQERWLSGTLRSSTDPEVIRP